MPKPVDEDRARRKQLLEQRKAARRKEKESREQQDALRQDATAFQLGNHNQTTQHHIEEGQPHPPLPSFFTNHSNHNPPHSLLPTDALLNILSWLSVSDLRRLWGAGATVLADPALQTAWLRHRYFLSFIAVEQQPTARLWRDAVCGGTTVSRITQTHSFLAWAAFLHDNHCNNVVSVSPEHSLLCTTAAAGHVASWGMGRRGQLGHGLRQDVRLPRRIESLSAASHARGGVLQVAAGGGLVRVAHSLLLCADGRVYSFGTGQYGALGHGFSPGRQLPDVLRPTRIAALATITCIAVAAGELHSAAITIDGDVYTWGDGFCGQLGHGDKRPVTTPQRVRGLEEEVVIAIACGSRHTLAITDEGECYSWGLGHFGVLGRSYTPFEYDMDDDAEDDTTAAAVVPDERDRAAELAAHLDLIATLTLDDPSDQCIPRPIVLADVRWVAASAGHRHTLLLDANGDLYSCGSGISGCLGHGNTESLMVPRRIVVAGTSENGTISSPGVQFRRMSAGVDMSMAVSTSGDVYAWGKTDGGRLGLGRNAPSIVTSPRRVSLDGMDVPRAVDVACGYVHSIVVALDGTLWQCGGVGVNGEKDGSQIIQEESEWDKRPQRIPQIQLWQPLPEPQKEVAPKARWQKLGKYEVKGRSQIK